MRLDAAQLPAQVKQKLAPAYLVAGDEVLLVEECCAEVRAQAATLGYERNLYTVEPGFDWNALFAEYYSPSLFAPRSLFEVRIPTGKPGDIGGKMLAQLVENPAPHALLLLVAPKLDKAQQQSAWVSAVSERGVLVNVWPLDSARWREWVAQRLKSRGVHAAPEVVQQLAYHMEGNLLACAQEIDKLALLFGDRTVQPQDIAETLSDNSRFTIYGWVDACLAGDAGDALRKLARVRAEGTEPILLLWAFAREARTLSRMARAVADGQNLAQVIQAHGVWSSRKPLVSQALRRLKPAQWLRLIGDCAHADRVLKGRAGADVGDIDFLLEQLTLACCGIAAPAVAIKVTR